MLFSKYHGLGNDFLIVDLREQSDEAVAVQAPANVAALCDRRFGVGADGVLALLPPVTDAAHARMRVLNADGGEAEMCGNGLRCVAKYLYERDPSCRHTPLVIDTGAGPLSCDVESSSDPAVATSITVDMGKPRLARREIPMSEASGPGDEQCRDQELVLADGALRWTAVSMGNPHAITFVDPRGPDSRDLRSLAESLGPAVESCDWFPKRTNVEFASIHSATDIELVVWERGCGITLACGTGACATAVAACMLGHAKPDTNIRIRLLGGDLSVRVPADYSTVFMTGPATHVYDAELDHLPSIVKARQSTSKHVKARRRAT